LNTSNTFIRDKNLQNAELQKNMNEYLEILANILKETNKIYFENLSKV
jgi:hypothetical protein